MQLLCNRSPFRWEVTVGTKVSACSSEPKKETYDTLGTQFILPYGKFFNCYISRKSFSSAGDVDRAGFRRLRGTIAHINIAGYLSNLCSLSNSHYLDRNCYLERFASKRGNRSFLRSDCHILRKQFGFGNRPTDTSRRNCVSEAR